MYRSCSNTYIQCTAHVQTCIYNSKFIGHCLNNVYSHTYCFSIYVCVHMCLALVHTMHIPGTYMKCTKTYGFVHVLDKQKFAGGRIEPRTSHRVSSRLNHRACSVVTIEIIVMVYVFCSTGRLVTYVRRRTTCPTRPHHDVAGPGLDGQRSRAWRS